MDSVSTTLTTFRPRRHGDASVPDNALPTAQDDAASKKMLDETIQNLGVEVLILPTVNFVDPVRRSSPQTQTLTSIPDPRPDPDPDPALNPDPDPEPKPEPEPAPNLTQP